MDTKAKYERLVEKVLSPKACDVGRSTIYHFPKYCHHCNQGMKKPKQWDRRTLKALFRRGYCSIECLNHGPQHQSTFVRPVKETPSYRRDPLIEEMAFASLELMREQQQRDPCLVHVYYAENNLGLLSEKLAYLEMMTGDRWYASKFYFWASKLG